MRFQVNSGSEPVPTPPAKYDAAGAEFAPGGQFADTSRQFVVEKESNERKKGADTEGENAATPDQNVTVGELQAIDDKACARESDRGDWRGEVAARVNRYRERRGSKEPRYPSLRLKFDGHEPSFRSAVSKEPAVSALGTAALSLSADPQISGEAEVFVEEPSAKVIEFPRPLILPTVTDELAEPILDRPRIIEAPELVPPPPALGGISIEQSAEEPRKNSIELPLQGASITRRVAAAVTDALIVASALALFGYIFVRISADYGAWRHPNIIVVVVPALFWFGYQYLFTAHARRTPGTALTRMTLQTFAGEPPSRNLRRWRVLASLLSAVSLGLGYGWCLLDEDQLCWHDRITHTYLARQRLAAP